MKKFYIYILIDPRDGQIRYVGKTNNPYNRYKSHISESKNPKTHKECWIKGILLEGQKPIIKTLCETDSLEKVNKLEVELIKHYKSFCNLTNEGEGGEGLSEVVLKKLRKPIIQYNKKGEFVKEWESITEAATYHNINNMTINAALKEEHKTAANYYWRRKLTNTYPLTINLPKQRILKEYLIPKSEDIIIGYSMFGNKNPMKQKAKKIVQYSLDNKFIKEWDSAKDAGRELNINASCIRRCCNGKYNQMKGFKFNYK